MDLTLLLYLIILLAVVSVVMALYWGSARTASAVDTRLKQINPNVVHEEDAPPVTERLVKGVAKVTAQLVPPSPRNVRRLRRRLMQAGFMGENAVAIFTAIRITSAAIFPLATMVILIVTRRPLDSSAFMLMLISIAFGLFIPSFMLSRQITKR